MMRDHAPARRRARGVVPAFIAVGVLFTMHGSVLATPAAPAATPCRAPEFQKSGEFLMPACGAPAGEVAKVSGKVTVTNRTPGELAHVILMRKGKILALAAVAASPGSTTASEVSFEYSEPAASYQVPIDLVIAPKCGPVLSISIDRPGRCE